MSYYFNHNTPKKVEITKLIQSKPIPQEVHGFYEEFLSCLRRMALECNWMGSRKGFYYFEELRRFYTKGGIESLTDEDKSIAGTLYHVEIYHRRHKSITCNTYHKHLNVVYKLRDILKV